MSARLRQLTEDRLSELLRALPPAPATWVRSAVQLPRMQRAVAEVRVRSRRTRIWCGGRNGDRNA